jgi:tetratricopeptide (TPR) repeat protein
VIDYCRKLVNRLASAVRMPRSKPSRQRRSSAPPTFFLALVAGLIVFAVMGASASAQTTTPSSPSDPQLYERIGKLESDVDRQGNEVTLILGVLGVMLSLSVVGFALTERRSHQIHQRGLKADDVSGKRAAEIHDLVVAGEKASQTRAAEVHSRFLEGSVDTLNLVNETLNLERMASERAARAVEDTTKRQINDLDQAARALISRVPSDDDHRLVTDPDMRDDLTSLARRISILEGHLGTMSGDLALKPHCLFVRGMQLHLEQQYDDAFREWDKIVQGDAARDDLRSLTWYWIGRERKNLGDYEQADQAFENALVGAGDARRYELKRIRLEIQFFEPGQYDAESLIEQLDRLVAEAEGDKSKAATKALPKIQATLGNVHHELGQEHLADAQVGSARQHFEAAAKIFRSIQAEKWAVFGLAEALWWLGEKEREEAEELFAEKARNFARDEYLHRIEYRAKVLARAAELLCSARAPSLREEVDHVYHDVLDALGHVDRRMTIYSELQRRNVNKTDFLEDMDLLRHQADHPPAPLPAP